MQIKKFIISRNDSVMEGWPDLIRLKNGRILVIYNECIAHSDRNHTHITMRISDDDGYTWSEKRYIGEETFHGDHWNSIRVNELSDGRIVLVCDRIEGNELSRETNLYLWESKDNGESWSEPRKLGIYGYCSDKIRELSDSTLLLCVSVYNAESKKTEIMAHKSSDGGKTWSDRILVAKSEKYTFIEPAALELTDGRVAVFMRENSLVGYNGFVVFSNDMGNSYGDFCEISVQGMHRPFVGYLKDGNIFLSYREHLGGKYPNLKACVFSGDKLSSKENFRILNIDYDTSENPDQGYSAWVQMPDGTILMANYIVDDAPHAYICGYRISI